MPRTLLIAFLILSASSNPLFAQRIRGKRKQSNKQEVVSEMDRVSGERAFLKALNTVPLIIMRMPSHHLKPPYPLFLLTMPLIMSWP